MPPAFKGGVSRNWLQRNVLYHAVHIANFEGILGLSVLSTILSKVGLTQITM